MLQKGIREESKKAAASQDENEALQQQLTGSQTGAVPKRENDTLPRQLEKAIQRATDSERDNEALQERLDEKARKLASSQQINEVLRRGLHAKLMAAAPSQEDVELRRQLEKAIQRAATSERENKGLQELLEEKSRKLTLFQQLHEELLQQLRGERQRVAAFKSQLGLALQEAQSTGPGVAIKVADNEIRSRWMDLRYQIRDFVRSNLVRSLPSGAVTPGMIEGFQDLVPFPKGYLESPHLAPMVFEARIWKDLANRVFSIHSELWAGRLGRLFYSLCCKEASGSYLVVYPTSLVPQLTNLRRGSRTE